MNITIDEDSDLQTEVERGGKMLDMCIEKTGENKVKIDIDSDCGGNQ